MAVPAHKHPQGLAVTALSYFKWQVILMNTPTLTSSIIVNVKVLQLEELLISNIYIAWQKVLYKNKVYRFKTYCKMLKKSLECSHQDSLGVFLLGGKNTYIFFHKEDNFCSIYRARKPQSSLMGLDSILLAYSDILSQDISS